MAKSLYTTTSKRNPYYISKHRYLELKHFCLQYPEWKKRYLEIESSIKKSSYYISTVKNQNETDSVSETASELVELSRKMRIVEQCCNDTDMELSSYIFKAVTEGCTYEYFQTHYGIPCCRDTFYSRYRKYFW